MTTKQKWALGLGALAVIAIIYFWNDISALGSNDSASDERLADVIKFRDKSYKCRVVGDQLICASTGL